MRGREIDTLRERERMEEMRSYGLAHPGRSTIVLHTLNTRR